MSRKLVYIETSIVSCLTARPTSDLLAAAWQKATVDWWETQRGRFDLYASDVTMEEAARGCLRCARNRVPADMELPSPGQRGDEARDQKHLRVTRLFRS